MKLSVERRENYVQDVCILLPQKYETHRVRLTEGLNLVGREIDARTTTAESVTIKTHYNRAIYDKMASTPT